jgi:hypothetical protein
LRVAGTDSPAEYERNAEHDDEVQKERDGDAHNVKAACGTIAAPLMENMTMMVKSRKVRVKQLRPVIVHAVHEC